MHVIDTIESLYHKFWFIYYITTLCKWIVKAIKPSESNLQLMLRYRLARYNSKKIGKWGVSINWFTSKVHRGFPGSRI